MQIHIADGWMFFCIAFGIMLLISFIMTRQAKHFCTNDVVLRRFSIMDLELPASALELANLVNGMYALPAEKKHKAINSLKAQLYTDFLFMPAAYATIFLLCMKVSWKMSSAGQELFAVLAWMQIIPFICDIIENIYLLKSIHPNAIAAKPSVHKAIQKIVIIKWAIALTGVICGISAVIYFWLVGRYETSSLKFLLIITGELILFFVAGKLFNRRVVTQNATQVITK